ncbi:MAG: chorismate mutase [Kiloniellales bacterium]|nr:chorismate mutase [Kiloniellales bacterium]
MTTPLELTEIRNKIDELDYQIVSLLVERIELALRASDYKSTSEEIRGADRVQMVLNNVGEMASGAGGHKETVKNIYRVIISELTDLQFRKKGV